MNKILSEVKTHPVGQKTPNSWCLYDTHGNALEWCQDTWHDNYNGAPSDGSAWEDSSGSHRVIRGGSWDIAARHFRSKVRSWEDLGIRNSVLGFRVLKTL